MIDNTGSSHCSDCGEQWHSALVCACPRGVPQTVLVGMDEILSEWRVRVMKDTIGLPVKNPAFQH